MSIGTFFFSDTCRPVIFVCNPDPGQGIMYIMSNLPSNVCMNESSTLTLTSSAKQPNNRSRPQWRILRLGHGGFGIFAVSGQWQPTIWRKRSRLRGKGVVPIPSMYGIFTYIWLIFMINVDKYTYAVVKTVQGCFLVGNFPAVVVSRTSPWKVDLPTIIFSPQKGHPFTNKQTCIS